MSHWLEIVFVIIIGLAMGSFITMASFRFAQEGKRVKELILMGSFCPDCHSPLKARNLIPLFSWLIQKGKCSFCGKKIALRYPLIELASALVFVVVYLASGKELFSLDLVMLFIIAVLLMIMIITDLEHYFIPNSTQIILALIAVIYHINDDSVYYLMSAGLFLAFGFALHYGFLLVTKKHGIGIDDIKFFAVTGLFLGIKQFPVFMILSGIFGIVFGIFWKKITKEQTFPFAPALATSLMICLFYGKQLTFYL